MKLVIFTIFIFLFMCNSATGISETHIWDKQLSSSDDFSLGASGDVGYYHGFDYIRTNNINNLEGLYFMSMSIDTDKVYAFDEDSEYSNVQFKIGSTIIGSGIAGYSKSASRIFINYWIQSDGGLDTSGFSGAQNIDVINMIDGSVYRVKYAHRAGAPDYIIMPYKFSSPWYYYGGGNIEINYYTYRYFYNEIIIEDDGTIIEVQVIKSSGNESKFTITDPSHLVDEASLNSDNILTATINNSINIYGINYAGGIFDYTYYGSISSDGTIKLNQSFYTEPEIIQIDADLEIYDFDNHIYRMLMEYSTDDGVNWERLSISYNTTSIMDNTSECRTATIDSSFYLLPIKIRAVIDDYDKTTSTSSTIATSSEVYYNPPSTYDYIISGTVFNADTGAIIEGALVSASGVTTTSSTSTVTGKFQLYLSEGIYTITTSKNGYQNDVQLDIVIDHDVTWAQIHLVPIGTGNGTLYGNVNDVDTGYAIKDVHVIITNATDSISAYTSSGGYYEATGLAQSSTYTIQAVKSGYYTYNGSVTTEASGATHKSFNMVPETATPTPTATVLPTTTYPGGEGHEWTNDEIVTMLRVTIPGFFLLMLVFLLLAVMLGIGGNNGNSGQGRSGLGELWRR